MKCSAGLGGLLSAFTEVDSFIHLPGRLRELGLLGQGAEPADHGGYVEEEEVSEPSGDAVQGRLPMERIKERVRRLQARREQFSMKGNKWGKRNRMKGKGRRNRAPTSSVL